MITSEDIFGDEDAEESISAVQNHSQSSSSDEERDKDCEFSVESKGTALKSRERLSMHQKLRAVQHFEANKITQKELAVWMFKNLKLKKEPSKAAVSKMFKPAELIRIKAFTTETNPALLNRKGALQPRFPELEDKLFAWFRRIDSRREVPTLPYFSSIQHQALE